MSVLERVRSPASTSGGLELAKLGAFVRRDFQIAWSYRMAFVSEWVTLAVQVAMFAYVGRLIDPSVLPTYGGTHATYMQFVTIGIAVSALMHLALGRVAGGLRTEQLTGTLEPLMLTPTAPATIQFGRLIDPSVLPTYGGTHATYMQFVTIGIAVSALMHLALGRVAGGLRTEQLTGTLEPLMLTPTAPATIQFGTVLYDLIYIPLRLALFLGIVAALFDLSFDPSGIAPAFVLLLALMPFLWGLGVANAAAALTFKRGGAGLGLLVSLIALGSGAYFPIELLPHWLYAVVRLNPVAMAITGIRRELIGGGVERSSTGTSRSWPSARWRRWRWTRCFPAGAPA